MPGSVVGNPLLPRLLPGIAPQIRLLYLGQWYHRPAQILLFEEKRIVQNIMNDARVVRSSIYLVVRNDFRRFASKLSEMLDRLERPVDSGRGNLEDVRLEAKIRVGVEDLSQKPADPDAIPVVNAAVFLYENANNLPAGSTRKLHIHKLKTGRIHTFRDADDDALFPIPRHRLNRIP